MRRHAGPAWLAGCAALLVLLSSGVQAGISAHPQVRDDSFSRGLTHTAPATRDGASSVPGLSPEGNPEAELLRAPLTFGRLASMIAPNQGRRLNPRAVGDSIALPRSDPTVSFVETGLPPGDLWEVNLTPVIGTNASSAANSSFGSSLSLTVQNGTY